MSQADAVKRMTLEARASNAAMMEAGTIDHLDKKIYVGKIDAR